MAHSQLASVPVGTWLPVAYIVVAIGVVCALIALCAYLILKALDWYDAVREWHEQAKVRRLSRQWSGPKWPDPR